MMSPDGLLHRRAVVREILREPGELVAVAGLGAPAWDITEAGDRDLNFPLWGAMGAAAMIGLGLALAQPKRRVVVVTGDGEMLMGLGALASIAAAAPANLALVVLDNERYGETGQQRTHTAFSTDLAAMAAGAGFRQAITVRDEAEARDLRAFAREAEGPVFANVKVDPEKLPLVLPPSEGSILKNRMRRALLGEEALYA